MSEDHVLLHVLGMGARVADPVDAVDRVDRAQQLSERRPVLAAQVAPVAVDVLAEQGHLADTVGGEALDLGEQLRRRAALLPAPRRGDDAIGADAVAALRDLQPRLERPLAAGRQVAGELLELEVALGGQRVAGQELGELVDLARAEGDVDEREALEDLVLDRLRPAAADADDPLRALGLEPLRLAEVGEEAAVGVLADRAGVEEDQVGVIAAVRLGVAERAEHPLHALGVVLVHLAAERGHVEALVGGRRRGHRGLRVAAARGPQIGGAATCCCRSRRPRRSAWTPAGRRRAPAGPPGRSTSRRSPA